MNESTYQELEQRVRELEETVVRHEEEKATLLARQHLLNSINDNVLMGIVVWSQADGILYANKGFTELTGYTKEDIRDIKDWFFTAYPDPEYRSQILDDLEASSGEAESIRNFRIICKNGEKKEIEFRRQIMKDGFSVVTLTDITERRKMEKALRESEERYRTVWETTGTAALMMQEDNTVVMVNSEFEKLSGLPREEIEGKMSWTEFVVPADLEMMKGYHKERRRKGGVAPRSYEFGFLDKNGKVKYVVNTTSIIPGTTDSVASLIDISKRRATEERLRESEEFYTRLIASMPDIVVRLDLDGYILFVNDAAKDISGYGREELEGKNMLDFIAPEDRERAVNNNVRMLESSLGPESYHMVMKDGSKRFFEVNGDVLRNDDGYSYGMVHVLRDITEREKAQKALRESEERYRTVLEMSPDPIVALDMTGNAVYLNNAFSRIFGLSLEDLNNRETNYTPEEEKPKARKMIEKIRSGEGISGLETRRLTKDGSVVDVSISAEILHDDTDQPVGSVVTLRDITEQKKLEKRLIQAHKMEAIGTLAGGIAHDFNNILSAIIGYSEVSLIETTPGSLINGNLKKLLKAGERARALVKQILTFSRQDEQEMLPLKVTPIVKEVMKFLRATLPTTIKIVQKGGSDATVLADPTQVHQILMNLCANAAHAMEEGGGILTLTMQDVKHDVPVHDPGTFESDPEKKLAPGTYLKISISDTGTGMSPEVLRRIFDPFFTTKKPGKGTGMGLSVVHGIVKSHDGRISVLSEPGKGSTFTVLLPVVQDHAAEERGTRSPLPTGTERILFIDDESLQVDLGEQILQKLGYRVLTCKNSLESLTLFRDRSDQIDLVITDMTMPEMTGDKLAAEIKKIRPDIPVILCTGFSEKISEDNLADLKIEALLYKPFLVGDLARTIRQVLEKTRS